MADLDYDALLEIVDAATPGQWGRLAGDYGRRIASLDILNVLGQDTHHLVCRVESQDGQHHRDGAYLATFSPPMVRRLIERARRADELEAAFRA